MGVIRGIGFCASVISLVFASIDGDVTEILAWVCVLIYSIGSIIQDL